jgi:hypothetical protein
MPINNAPTREGEWSQGWRNWFTQVLGAIFGWRSTFTGVKSAHDFSSINAQSQDTTTLTITGVSSGDAVHVTPVTPTSGILVDGYVSAADTVTIRAHNYTSGSVDPASSDYRVIVFQQ